MAAYAASRFGQDGPARFATSTEVLLEDAELPSIPIYQAVVPFVPLSFVGDDLTPSTTLATADGGADWFKYPQRLDLHFYQGDDIQIPFFFQDPDDVTLDMSEHVWKSQIRTRHRYYSRFVHEFTVVAEDVLPIAPATDPTGITKVTLFLPRANNQYSGVYRWDLQDTGPFVGPEFGPAEPPVLPWPPVDQVKTWLYGYVFIAPRVTWTDVLP